MYYSGVSRSDYEVLFNSFYIMFLDSFLKLHFVINES